MWRIVPYSIFCLMLFGLSKLFVKDGSSMAASLINAKAKKESRQFIFTRHAQLSHNYFACYALDTAVLNEFAFPEDSIPDYPDLYYVMRIKSIDSEIPLTFNSDVKRLIRFYINQRRYFISSIIGRGYDYFPVLKSTLEKEGMPVELVNLAAIESALDSNAYSRCGACGIWQFMPATARSFNLKVSRGNDQRKNVELSTAAAMKYLNHLYKRYDDWFLALAAYNAGPGRVNRALKKAGLWKSHKKDYWKVMNYLPKETQGYIPGFIAMCYLMENYKAHNLKAFDPNLYKTETARYELGESKSITELSAALPLRQEEIIFFNPNYESSKVFRKGIRLKLPVGVEFYDSTLCKVSR